MPGATASRWALDANTTGNGGGGTSAAGGPADAAAGASPAANASPRTQAPRELAALPQQSERERERADRGSDAGGYRQQARADQRADRYQHDRDLEQRRCDLERLVLRDGVFSIAASLADEEVFRPESFEGLEIALTRLWG